MHSAYSPSFKFHRVQILEFCLSFLSQLVKCDVVEARDCSGCSDCSLQKLREAGVGLQISRMMLASFFPKSDVNESFDKPQSSKLRSRNRSVICIYRLLELDMKESQLWNRIVPLGRDLK